VVQGEPLLFALLNGNEQREKPPMKTNYFLSSSTDGFHRMAYSEWGQPDSIKPIVFCVHGVLRHRFDFDALAGYLSRHDRHVFCPDIVGRGDSDWFENPKHYHFEQYVIDMTVLFARSVATKIDWIGTSMGGLIGMMMAALPNSPISRLILNDVGPQVPLSGLRRIAKYADTHHKFATVAEATQHYKEIYKSFGQLSESQWTTFTEHSITQKPDGTYVAKCDPTIAQVNKTHAQWMWDFMHHPHKSLEGIFFDVDLWSVWKQIKCPVLIIHGRHSDILLPEIIKKMQQTHPNTALIEVDDAGHAPALLEQAQHERIKAWLDKH